MTQPNPIPVYTQGDDLQTIDGKIAHVLTTTAGTDTRTAEPVISGPLADLKNTDQIKAAIAAWHERHGT